MRHKLVDIFEVRFQLSFDTGYLFLIWSAYLTWTPVAFLNIRSECEIPAYFAGIRLDSEMLDGRFVCCASVKIFRQVMEMNVQSGPLCIVKSPSHDSLALAKIFIFSTRWKRCGRNTSQRIAMYFWEIYLNRLKWSNLFSRQQSLQLSNPQSTQLRCKRRNNPAELFAGFVHEIETWRCYSQANYALINQALPQSLPQETMPINSARSPVVNKGPPESPLHESSPPDTLYIRNYD